MCWTFSVRYNMYLGRSILVFFIFVLFLIYHAKYLRHYLSKTNGYVVLKRKCYPLYMRKTCMWVCIRRDQNTGLQALIYRRRVRRPNVKMLSTPLLVLTCQ